MLYLLCQMILYSVDFTVLIVSLYCHSTFEIYSKCQVTAAIISDIDVVFNKQVTKI